MDWTSVNEGPEHFQKNRMAQWPPPGVWKLSIDACPWGNAGYLCWSSDKRSYVVMELEFLGQRSQ